MTAVTESDSAQSLTFCSSSTPSAEIRKLSIPWHYQITPPCRSPMTSPRGCMLLKILCLRSLLRSRMLCFVPRSNLPKQLVSSASSALIDSSVRGHLLCTILAARGKTQHYWVPDRQCEATKDMTRYDDNTYVSLTRAQTECGTASKYDRH